MYIYIYICVYYIHIYPNRRRVFQVPHPSFPEGTLLISAGLQDVDSSLGGHGGCIPQPYLEISGDIPPVLVAWNMDTRIPSGKLT